MATPRNLTAVLAVLLLTSLACAGQKAPEPIDSEADADTDADSDTDADADVACPIASDDFLTRFAGDERGDCGLSATGEAYYTDVACTGEADGSWVVSIQGMLTPMTCVPDAEAQFTCAGEDASFAVSAEGFVSELGQRFEGELSVSGNCNGSAAFIAVAD